jgi:hypothetical protein
MPRKYETTHPWLQFALDLRKIPYDLWIALGECQSKCEHIAGTPLQPAVSEFLHCVYLAKGVAATTAIEGNTLSEEQVRQLIAPSDLKILFPGRLEHYRGVEVASEPFFRIVKSGNGVSLTRIASD